MDFRFQVVLFCLFQVCGKLESTRAVLLRLIGDFCFIVSKWFRRINER